MNFWHNYKFKICFTFQIEYDPEEPAKVFKKLCKMEAAHRTRLQDDTSEESWNLVDEKSEIIEIMQIRTCQWKLKSSGWKMKLCKMEAAHRTRLHDEHSEESW